MKSLFGIVSATAALFIFASCGQGTHKKPHYAENTSGLYINEVLSSNNSAYLDSEGRNVDYIELVNEGAEDLNISSFGLSDKAKCPPKYKFPKGTVLPAGGYIVVNCSKEYSEDPQQGACFSISSSRDSLFLFDPKGRIIDVVPPTETLDDQGYLRLRDSTFKKSFNISPGYPNTLSDAISYKKASSPALPQVYISEVLSRSSSGWIEICNSSDAAVNLAGYSLSKKADEPGRFVFPDFQIPPQSYQTISLGKSTKNLSTGFNLHDDDAICLFDPEGKLLDHLSLSGVRRNVSCGRNASDPLIRYYRTATPGKPNTGGSLIIADVPFPSVRPGIYNDVDTLEVSLEAEGAIYYTLNGSSPNSASRKYSGPFKISKTTVIRAICSPEEGLDSEIATFTYLINENNTLDVVCMAGNDADFYSEATGIFSGVEETPERPSHNANFWKHWKRQVNVSFFPLEGEGFSENCAVSVFGGYSRMNAKKSVKFKFKDIYGPHRLRYHLFENLPIEEFDSFVLRCGGQDTYRAMMRDDLAACLADDILDVMASRPAVFYINGAYKGIYYIREKINDHYLANHHDIPEEGIDMVFSHIYTEIGSIKDWNALLAYVRANDLKNPECYEYVKQRVNLVSYADWVIAEVYCDNNDPGNVRCWRSDSYDSGRWNWILYDVDMGFNSPDSKFYSHYLYPTNKSNTQTVLIRSLLSNPEFRELFLERLEFQMHNIWNRDRVIATIDSIASKLDGEVERNGAVHRMSKKTWEGRVEFLREYARKRQGCLKNYFATDPELTKLLKMTPEELDRCFESQSGE